MGALAAANATPLWRNYGGDLVAGAASWTNNDRHCSKTIMVPASPFPKRPTPLPKSIDTEQPVQHKDASWAEC
jgi:hypothetical protein